MSTLKAGAVLVAVAAVLAGTSVFATRPGGVDDRAAAYCPKSDELVDYCAVETHVALKVVDAFSTIYPADAQPIKAGCEEVNQHPVAIAACITSLVEMAVQIGAADGVNTSGDLVLDSAKDRKLFSTLLQTQIDAQRSFPDHIFWGATTFTVYGN